MASVEELGFNEENQKAIDVFFSAGHPSDSVAVFDLDGTCLHGDAGEAVFRTMAQKGLFNLVAVLESPDVWDPFRRFVQVLNPRRAVMDYLYGSVPEPVLAKAMVEAYQGLLRHAGKEMAYRWPVLLMAGKTVSEIASISRDALGREADRAPGKELLTAGPEDKRPVELDVGLVPYRAMRQLLDRLGKAGIETWIVTASNHITAQVCAEMFLGIPAERVLGIAPSVVDGTIRGQLDPGAPVTFGSGKVEAIDRYIGRTPVFVAGDSINQLPMMDLATGLKLVIYKGNRELLDNIALRRKVKGGTWLIQPRFIDPPELP